MNSRGFTLVELVLVIVLVGILAVFAAPRFSTSTFDAGAAAGELVEAIRYAQSMTMSQGGVERYAVTISASGYRVLRNGADTPDPAGGASYANSWSRVSISPTGTIAYDGRGRPTCSGGLDCSASTQAIALVSGAASMSVRIEPVTGYVR